jgi:hypothetical protein
LAGKAPLTPFKPICAGRALTGLPQRS